MGLCTCSLIPRGCVYGLWSLFLASWPALGACADTAVNDQHSAMNLITSTTIFVLKIRAWKFLCRFLVGSSILSKVIKTLIFFHKGWGLGMKLHKVTVTFIGVLIA